MTEAELAELTARYQLQIAELTARHQLAGAIISALILALTAALLAPAIASRFQRRRAEEQAHRDQRAADEQLRRDRRLQADQLNHQELAATYRQLDSWISRVTNQATDFCFGDDLADLPEEDRTEYGVCVALHKGVLRTPAEGQYLWSPDVENLVDQLKDQAVEMATMVLLSNIHYPDDHGHDLLDKIAAELRRAMRADLERDPAEPQAPAAATEP